MNLEYAKIALKNLKQRKLRSSLTILGMVIAVLTIFVLISLSLGLEHAVEEQFRLLGTDKIFIQPRGQLAGPGTGGAVELTIKDVEAIENVRGVKDLSWSVAAPAEIVFGNEKRFFNVIGFPLDKSDVFLESGAYKPDEGRLLEEGDKGDVMIGSHYKYNNIFKKPIRARDSIDINGEEFNVKGIISPIGNPGDDRIIYMGIDEFRKLFSIEKRIDFIIIQVEAGEDINEAASRIEDELLESRNLNEEKRDFTILTPEELLASFGVVLTIVTAFLLGVAAISLIVGGINMANTMYTSVLERTKEIGVMKSIGAKNKDIFAIFLIESGLLGLVGGIAGVILGWAISKGLEIFAVRSLGTTLLQTETPIFLFAGCLAFAFAAGAIFGSIPAMKASKSRVVDALRYE